MDHKALIATIPADVSLTLTARADGPGLRYLAVHLGALLFTSVWISAALPLWQFMLLLHGVLLVFLFTLEHETTHQTPFKTRWLNEAVGHSIGAVLLLPFTWFRYFHLAHHRYTNDPERDPELLGGGKPQTWGAYLIYTFGWTYWTGMLWVILKSAFGRSDFSYVPKRALARVRREARVLCGIYAFALLSLTYSDALLWLWLIPMLLGQPFLRLFLLAEHAHCANVADMLANTRTTFTNRLVRRLAWNMPYHTEHHAMPGVPFHQLPRLHLEMAPYLKETAPGYGKFSQHYVAGLE